MHDYVIDWGITPQDLGKKFEYDTGKVEKDFVKCKTVFPF